MKDPNPSLGDEDTVCRSAFGVLHSAFGIRRSAFGVLHSSFFS
jgi:hypothetical protein